MGIPGFDKVTTTGFNSHFAIFVSFDLNLAFHHHYLYPFGMGMFWNSHACRHSKESRSSIVTSFLDDTFIHNSPAPHGGLLPRQFFFREISTHFNLRH
ncbi:uncharacterized protein METZ01_LOCUS299352 [marine metagenome]|uniref:Uncharacterized protein n=1 Tax=marine metagenome TaxID=408172 RepID=A0A382MD77_9ZZZZ